MIQPEKTNSRCFINIGPIVLPLAKIKLLLLWQRISHQHQKNSTRLHGVTSQSRLIFRINPFQIDVTPQNIHNFRRVMFRHTIMCYHLNVQKCTVTISIHNSELNVCVQILLILRCIQPIRIIRTCLNVVKNITLFFQYNCFYLKFIYPYCHNIHYISLNERMRVTTGQELV